ncbi:hypothetical protein ONZ45_g6070 [Pleurotus djamor]|nr:hypothetical protein ONZ45_g6070 [Pleurotus djamor]
MKLASLSIALGLCISAANADYFSAGWSPGQPVPTGDDTPLPTYTPTQHSETQKPQGGILERVLSSGPFASLFERAGVNISEKIAQAQNNALWDERIPLITDSNYEETIVNETLTEEEEEKRVWFLVITVTASKQDGVSKIVDDLFDSAYNETQANGELQHVRWGRIDYLNVTAITTRWAVWHAPVLVVLRRRGQELRFYRPYQLNLKAEAMIEFLRQDGWQATPPWSSVYAPGGSREYVMEYLALVLTKTYNFLILFPNWLLLVLSGGLATFLIKILHKEPAPTAPKKPSTSAVRKPGEASTTVSPTPGSSSQTSQDKKQTGIKQRKGGKK